MEVKQHDDADRLALIQLRHAIAASRPTGLRGRIKRRRELQTADMMLAYEDARAYDIRPATLRLRLYYAVFFLTMGYATIRALLRSGSVTDGVGISMLVLEGLVAIGVIATARAQAARARDDLEGRYQRWLERARRLPSINDTTAPDHSNAAV